MTLEELKAAVEKFHDGTNTSYDIYGAEIAEALTDPTPITLEGLEALGGVRHDEEDGVNYDYRIAVGDHAAVYFAYRKDEPGDGPIVSFARRRQGGGVGLPYGLIQTRGDVRTLLLQLGRKGE